MARKKVDNVLVGLDLGTTKVCAIAGLVKDGEPLEIIGIGTAQSQGLKKGVVVNIDSTVDSIKRAIREAEKMAGIEITSVYVGISGNHIKGHNSHGVTPIKNREVTPADVARAVDGARTMPIPGDQKILHVIPQEFIIDSQGGIKDPVGMSGVRLDVKVHVITGALAAVQNIEKSCSRAGLEVIDMVLQPLAASRAVLTAEEQELGVAVIDIGGGTTDMALFRDGSLWHSEVLPIGGNQLTHDIAVGLQTPTSEAEKIKVKYGCALASLVKPGEEFEVPSVSGRPPRLVGRQILSEIIEPRIAELFEMVNIRLKNAFMNKVGYEKLLASGIVLTGGTAMMDGVQDAAEHIIGLPVQRGSLKDLGGIKDMVSKPEYATGVGLVLYGAANMQAAPTRRSGGGMITTFKKWMEGFV